MSNLRVFIVTGANKGIGKSIVKSLLQDKEEKIVYLTSRNIENGKEAVRELQSYGFQPEFHQLNISNLKSVQILRDFLVERHGGFDVLVNNAGVADRGCNAFDGAQKTLKCNFFATVDVCETLIPILKQNGRIINVSSISGINAFKRLSGTLQETFGNPHLSTDKLKKLMKDYILVTKEGKVVEDGWTESAYGISKLGITCYTAIQQKIVDTTYSERNITMNSCCPGLVATDMTRNKHEMMTMKTPDEGADTPTYLALAPADIKDFRGCFVINKKIVKFPPVDD